MVRHRLNGYVDTITDFSSAQGDVLDLSPILTRDESFDITEYLRFEDDGTDTTVAIDTNGGGNSFPTLSSSVTSPASL
ncbi:MAG: type I secretion C-terminal target domain-containing protein [Magnetovibrio sp.]|nr:type I secretion C-terminal target domain-containing protein [Magnetovibrio sp.]